MADVYRATVCLRCFNAEHTPRARRCRHCGGRRLRTILACAHLVADLGTIVYADRLTARAEAERLWPSPTLWQRIIPGTRAKVVI